MSVRDFRFMYHHSMRAAGAANITASHAMAAGFPVDHLHDNRAGALQRFNAAAANQNIFWDRGAAFALLPSLDRLIVPAGHNWDSAGTIEIEEDTDSTFDETISLTLNPVNPGFLDATIPTPLTKRFVMINWPNATILWEATQLMLTNTLTFTRGSDLGVLRDTLIDNVDTFEKPSGKAPSLVRGVSQRRFVPIYRALNGADLVNMEAFVAEVGTHAPFWVDPPQFGHFTTLVDAINTSEDNINKDVVSTAEFPASPTTYNLKIGTEEIQCTTVDANTINIETSGRAQNGTTAEAHIASDVVLEMDAGAVLEYPRWMKFQRIDSSHDTPARTGKRFKSYTLTMIDHVD